MNENELYQELLKIESRVGLHEGGELKGGELKSIIDYADLVREAEWQQKWDSRARSMSQLHDMRGSIWSDVIERCLKEHGCAYVPKISTPIYIDRPIVLRSGNRLIVHPETEIRLKVGAVGTCMVRNSQVVLSQDRPVQLCRGADEDIFIEGGIWCDQNNEGRGRGGEYDQKSSVPGSMGMFLFHNVSRVVVRNVIFRDCSAFAVQIGNATDYIIEDITFDETADGIHVEGPSQRGIIRHIHGKTNDDAVALNAWDWQIGSITFGPITDVLVEDIEMQPGYTWSELRLLPGTKIFSSGETLDCDIRRCIFRNIRGIHTFKMYDQPNIGNPEEDFADPIGKMSDLFFSDIVVDGIHKSEYYDLSSDGVLDICADIDGISIRDVRFNYIPGQSDMAPYLVSVGPKSLTWHREPSSESGSCWRPSVKGIAEDDEWVDVFNPNANPVVKGLVVKEIDIPDQSNPDTYVPHADLAALIHERRLTPNPDFPNTMPRGGTGSGKVLTWTLDEQTSHDCA
ncbi:MAG: hypothetical protein GY759_12585 [Chloroflexi bacterium]|nr:hypothetical protein [Chloroflexota bacterium]